MQIYQSILRLFLWALFSGLTIKKILLPCIGVIIAVIITMFFARPLNILSLGDDYARSLGLNVNPDTFYSACFIKYYGRFYSKLLPGC